MPYKRGSTWYITVQGTRRSSGTTDRKKAAALEHKLNSEAWERKHFGIRFATWDEACLDWFKTKGVNLRPITIRRQSYVAQYWQTHLSGKSLRAITAESINRILLAREGVSQQERTPANATANLYAQFVRKVMNHAGMKLVGLYPLPASKGREEWLSVDQWGELESVMRDDLRRIATFSLATGLRKSNVIGLQWDWIKGDAVFIPSDMAKTNTAYGIPLNRTALGVIQEIRSQPVVHARNVFLLGGKEVEEVPLHRAWKRALKASGVEDMTYHGLRHTYASWMVQAGVPFEIVSRLGQWKLPGVVHRYTHFDVESLRPWANRFDSLLISASVEEKQSASS